MHTDGHEVARGLDALRLAVAQVLQPSLALAVVPTGPGRPGARPGILLTEALTDDVGTGSPGDPTASATTTSPPPPRSPRPTAAG